MEEKQDIKKVNKKRVKEWININIGLLIATFSFSFFLDPNLLVIGGTGGIGTIFGALTPLNTSLVILIFNVILLIISFFALGKGFFIKTVYASLVYPAFTYLWSLLFNVLFKTTSPLTDGSVDMTLIIIISALLMGAGIGLTIKSGASTGGVDIIQYILLKYLHIPLSVSLIIVDGSIVVLGTILLSNYSLLLYAIVFIYVSGMAMDAVVYNGFNKRAVHIISEHNEEIKQRILYDFERGVTNINVIGGYTNQNRSELVCVLSNGEFYRLKSIIKEIDPKAFYYVVRASEVGGEGFTYE